MREMIDKRRSLVRHFAMKKCTLVSVVVILLAMATPAFAGQPHMQDALSHLRAARAALSRAEANKGGHRERALEHVDAAIRETEAGIAFAAGKH